MSAFTLPLKTVCEILDTHPAYDDVYPANETVYYDGFSNDLNLWESENADIVNVAGRMNITATTTGNASFLATLELINLIPGRTYHVSVQAMSGELTDVDVTTLTEVRWQGAPGGGGATVTWQMQNYSTSFVAAHERETVQILGSRIGGGTFTIKYDNFRVVGDAFTVHHAADFTAVGLNDYPIFNPSYRDGLNEKIVRHYWNREIGFETIELFVMKMKTLMGEIMPYYNQLYESTLHEIDPLSTINLTTETTGHGETNEQSEGDSTALNTTDSQSRAVQSTTPQTMLAGDEDYATGAADSRSKTDADSTASQTSQATTESDTMGETRVTGYQGAAATLIMNYRDSLINIDLMVIRDLEQLFMQIFDNSSSYTQRGIFW